MKKLSWTKERYHIEGALAKGLKLPSLREALSARIKGQPSLSDPLWTCTSAVYFREKGSICVAFSEYSGILKHILVGHRSRYDDPPDTPPHPLYAKSRYFQGNKYRSCHDLRMSNQRIPIEEPPIQKIIEDARRNRRIIRPRGNFGYGLEEISKAIGNKELARDYARFLKKNGISNSLYLSVGGRYLEEKDFVDLKFVFCPGKKPKIAIGFGGHSIGLVVGSYDYSWLINACPRMNDYGLVVRRR